MKHIYIAVTVKENEKYYAYCITATTADNLLSVLSVKNIIHANVCESRKAAARLVDFWNECYKNNGTYMFSEPNF